MVALKSEKTKTSWGRLGKCVCVCVCVSALSVNDALHVGNFLVSCIPIGSSPRQNATKIGGVQSRIAQSILAN